MTTVEYPDSTEIDYRYDDRNNLIKKERYQAGSLVNQINYTYDIENRLLSMGDRQFSYDRNGNKINTSNSSERYLFL